MKKDIVAYIAANKYMLGTWDNCADLFERETGEHISGDTLRKRIAAYKEEEGDVFQQFNADKIVYRDERNALRSEERKAARLDWKLDYLEQKIQEIGRKKFPAAKATKKKTQDKAIIMMMTDWHVGLSYDNAFGRFNSDIARKRAADYVQHVKKLQEIYKAKECVVVCMGDMISGNIHKTIQITNREDVIDQIEIVVDIISGALHELETAFPAVRFASVCGNHTRIDRKDEALKDERLDRLISWMIGALFRHDKRIQVEREIDSTIAEFDVMGRRYFAIHGDYDGFNRAGAEQLISTVGGTRPEAILYGHLHTCAVSDEQNVKLIRGGSLCGSGDEYTIQKRLTGRPSQMALICSSEGVESYHPVYFK